MVVESCPGSHLCDILQHPFYLRNTETFAFYEIFFVAFGSNIRDRSIELKAFPFNFKFVFVWKLFKRFFEIPFSDVTERTHYIAPYFNFHF